MKRNFIFTAVSVGSRLLAGLLLFLLLARLWGPAQFGLFSFVFSACALLALLVDFGFGMFLMREIAAAPGRAADLIGAAFRAKLLLAVIASMAAILVAWAAGHDSIPSALMAPLYLAALGMSFAEFFVAPLRALGRFDLEAGVVAASNAVQFLLAGGVAWLGGSLLAVAWSTLGARCLYLVLARRAARSVVPGLRLGQATAATGMSGSLRMAWPYGVDNMLSTAWSQLDVVVVRAIFGIEAVGLYSAGQRIVVGVSALAPVVGNVMIPRLTVLAAHASPRFLNVGVKTGALMVLIGACFALPMIFIPAALADGMLGSAYLALADLLPLFGLALLLRYVAASTGIAATAAGMQVKRVLAQLLGISVAVLLIAYLSLQGLTLRQFIAAIAAASLSASALHCVYLWHFFKSTAWRSRGKP